MRADGTTPFYITGYFNVAVHAALAFHVAIFDGRTSATIDGYTVRQQPLQLPGGHCCVQYRFCYYCFVGSVLALLIWKCTLTHCTSGEVTSRRGCKYFDYLVIFMGVGNTFFFGRSYGSIVQLLGHARCS